VLVGFVYVAGLMWSALDPGRGPLERLPGTRVV
jgi:hypothetical protein